MNYCQNCGEKVKGDASYCSNCGQQLLGQETERRDVDRIKEELKRARKNEMQTGILAAVLLTLGVMAMAIGFMFGSEFGGERWPVLVTVGSAFILAGLIFLVLCLAIFGQKRRDLEK